MRKFPVFLTSAVIAVSMLGLGIGAQAADTLKCYQLLPDNPDVLELTRGKTARVIGNLQALLVLVKGLPLAYNRDLQEDKEAIFDSFDTVELCLELAAPLVAGAKLNRESDGTVTYGW